MSDTIDVSIKVQDTSTVNVSTLSDRPLGACVAESFDTVSPIIDINDGTDTVTITTTDKYGKKTAEIPKGVDDYERLKNMPKLEDKVIRGNKTLDYYGVGTLTNLEIQALLA